MVEIWAFVASWFTPTGLFLLLNIVIGTIFLSSLFGSPNNKHHHHNAPPLAELTQSPPPLVRAPSLLSRVTSFNFSHYYRPPQHEDPHPGTFEPDSTVDCPFQPAPIQRAPSFLSRVASGFSWPAHPDESGPDPGPVARAPSLLPRVAYGLHWPVHVDPHQADTAAPHEDKEEKSGWAGDGHAPEPDVAPMTRAPSLLSRMASGFYRSVQSDPVQPSTAVEEVREARKVHLERAKSQPEEKTSSSDVAGKKEKMKKAASEKELGRNETALFGADEEVDAKADDFIYRFKQQLKLQRLDSLLRYRNNNN